MHCFKCCPAENFGTCRFPNRIWRKSFFTTTWKETQKMTLTRHELRQSKNSLMIWTVSIGCLMAVCIFLFPEIKSEMSAISAMFASMEAFLQRLAWIKSALVHFLDFMRSNAAIFSAWAVPFRFPVWNLYPCQRRKRAYRRISPHASCQPRAVS